MFLGHQMEWKWGRRAFTLNKIIQTRFMRPQPITVPYPIVTPLSKNGIDCSLSLNYQVLSTSVYFLPTMTHNMWTYQCYKFRQQFSLDVFHLRANCGQCEWKTAFSEMLLLKAHSNFLLLSIFYFDTGSKNKGIIYLKK